MKIGCEISVTTGSDQELHNIEKCFAAAFDRVVLIADDPRRLAALRKAIAAALDEKQAVLIAHCIAEDIGAVLTEAAGGLASKRKKSEAIA